jgi:hypothetical protein
VTSVVPLSRNALARVAPNYEAMRTAIAACEKVDEIANLADQAVAAQAYYRQSQDVDNEMQASRIRVRAERRLGEILRAMAERGERATRQTARSTSAGKVDAPTLEQLGIPQGRAARAMQLADVPNEQFEAALAEPVVAQPRRILAETKAPPHRSKPPPLVPIDHTLSLWGKVRELGSEIESGGVPDLKHWRENLQPFQLDHMRRYVPVIVRYLSRIQEDL